MRCYILSILTFLLATSINHSQELDETKKNIISSIENHQSEIIKISDQIWYCESQKRNDKTRAILEKWFDTEWTDKYMNEVLFDEPSLKSISRPSFEGPY